MAREGLLLHAWTGFWSCQCVFMTMFFFSGICGCDGLNGFVLVLWPIASALDENLDSDSF